MKEKVRHIISRLHPRRVPELLNTFLKDESISGKLILLATVAALVVVNSPWREAYHNFWQLSLSIGIGNWGLGQDLRHWVSEGLMSFFFLVVGLEIRREIIKGELQDRRKAVLPIAAALGGMVLPAIIYLSLNMDPEVVRGWGIPIATDIAFAAGILMLLGRRVPLALKVFLLTLAIADDIGAIIVIGLFYAEIIHFGYLFVSIALLVGMWLLRKRFIGRLGLFLALGIVLWVTTHLSGIHASIVGVAIGLLTPLGVDRYGRSMAERLEKLFLPLSTFVALPIFAFANAGVVLSTRAFDTASSSTVMLGVILGLVLGKVIGITLATWAMVQSGYTRLPTDVNWSHIIGVGFIAGIGFTVSIFITELAFGADPQLVETAKISIFIASSLSALLGSLILLRTKKLTD